MGLGEELSAAASGYQRLSLWWEDIPVPLPPRPALTEDLDVDVCIVGAGFTGLWTAHALVQADPTLRIAVLEREVAGFGASGRNGGWCSALFATSDAALARQHGPEAMRAMRRAMQETVDIVGASDSVTANLAAALGAKATLTEAMEVAMAAASVVVHQLGTTGEARTADLAAMLRP